MGLGAFLGALPLTCSFALGPVASGPVWTSDGL